MTNLSTALTALYDERVKLNTELDITLIRTERIRLDLADLDAMIDRLENMGAQAPATLPEPAAKKKRERPQRRTGKPPGPHTGKPSYEEIAAKIAELREEGTPIQRGLGAFYGKPPSTIKNWLTRCREMGLIEPAVRGRPVHIGPTPEQVEDDIIASPYADVAPDDPPTSDDVTMMPSIHADDPLDFGSLRSVKLQVLAEEYLDLRRRGAKPLNELSAKYLCDRRAVQERIAVCREMGLLPPRDEPQLSPEERAALLALVPNGPSPLKGTQQ